MIPPDWLQAIDSTQVTRDASGKLTRIEILRPSDFHGHLRQGAVTRAVIKPITRMFKYFLAMPNNGENGPIWSVDEMLRYRNVLYSTERGKYNNVNFIVTLYLTRETTPAVIRELARLAQSGIPCAVKYYPPHKGATTGSGHGIALSEATETLREMEILGVRLLGHFESVYDKNGRELPHALREGYFMEHEFPYLRNAFPRLKISIEHASTIAAYNRVLEDTSGNTACTVPPQHLMFTVRDLQRLSWRNHLKCMPIVKTSDDIAMGRERVTSGDYRFILGTDTAPHLSRFKIGSFDDCASGCYVPHALALYAQVFDEMDALENGAFVRFASMNGPKWWGLPLPEWDDTVILQRPENGDGLPDPTAVPEENDRIIPLGWTTEPDRLKVGLTCT